MRVLKAGSGLVVTVPKALAEGISLEAGDTVTWKVAGKNRLELVKE